MIKCNQSTMDKLTHLLWDDQVEQVACLAGKQEGEDYLVTDVLPARNEDYRPAEEFFISARQMAWISAEAQHKGIQLLGVAHTHLAHHPLAPSEADIRYCKHAVNLVYHPASNTVTWFNCAGEIHRERVSKIRSLQVPSPSLAFV